MIAVVVITHNRLPILRKCVENVLLRTSPLTSEIVIWDNGSTDGTPDYLRSLDDPRIRAVCNPTNVGMNGYARGFAMSSAPYMVELDDDVTDSPHNWDKTLLDAFERLPDVGFLAADLVDDPLDTASYHRHHIRPHEYVEAEENGVRILLGPAGGGCAITSRELADRVGGFRERPGEIFWLEDEQYLVDIGELGFRGVVLADLRVHHTGGAHYLAGEPAEKTAYWERYERRRARRRAVKRALLAVPLVGRLNRRFAWFEPPVTEPVRPSGRTEQPL